MICSYYLPKLSEWKTASCCLNYVLTVALGDSLVFFINPMKFLSVWTLYAKLRHLRKLLILILCSLSIKILTLFQANVLSETWQQLLCFALLLLSDLEQVSSTKKSTHFAWKKIIIFCWPISIISQVKNCLFLEPITIRVHLL